MSFSVMHLLILLVAGAAAARRESEWRFGIDSSTGSPAPDFEALAGAVGAQLERLALRLARDTERLLHRHSSNADHSAATGSNTAESADLRFESLVGRSLKLQPPALRPQWRSKKTRTSAQSSLESSVRRAVRAVQRVVRMTGAHFILMILRYP